MNTETIAKLIARHGRQGYAETVSRERLADIVRRHGAGNADNFAHALSYEGFATARMAERAAAEMFRS